MKVCFFCKIKKANFANQLCALFEFVTCALSQIKRRGIALRQYSICTVHLTSKQVVGQMTLQSEEGLDCSP